MNGEMHHKVVLANGVAKYTLVEAIPSFSPKMKATSFPSNLHLFPGNKSRDIVTINSSYKYIQ